MKSLFLSIVLLALAACSEPSERSYTVDELVANDRLLSTLIQKCRNNPGKFGNTVNCMNAEAAYARLRFERMQQSAGG